MATDLEHDLDDDLFEFDELAEEPPPPAFELDSGPAPARRSAPRSMGLVDDLEPAQDAYHDGYGDGDGYGTEPRVVVASGGLPPIVVPLLLVMAAANLALVGLTWRSMGPADGPALPALVALPSAEEQAGELDPALRTEADQAAGRGTGPRGFTRTVPALASSRDDAWAILDEAQRALDAGEFVPARRTLYAMLTVIDRVEAAERPDLESRAAYLVAESYRLQAAALKPRPEAVAAAEAAQ